MKKENLMRPWFCPGPARIGCGLLLIFLREVICLSAAVSLMIHIDLGILLLAALMEFV